MPCSSKIKSKVLPVAYKDLQGLTCASTSPPLSTLSLILLKFRAKTGWFPFSLYFFENSKLLPASGPSYVLFLLPGTLLPPPSPGLTSLPPSSLTVKLLLTGAFLDPPSQSASLFCTFIITCVFSFVPLTTMVIICTILFLTSPPTPNRQQSL